MSDQNQNAGSGNDSDDWLCAQNSSGNCCAVVASPPDAPNKRRLSDSLWGKSRGLEAPYPLLAHLLDTAATAQVATKVLVPRSLAAVIAGHMRTDPETWRQMVAVLAGWHDVGKASCAFQQQDAHACATWLKESTDRPNAGRHDLIGSYLAWDKLAGHPSRYKAVQIIGGHHGKIPSPDRFPIRELGAFGGAGLVDRDDPPPELLKARQEVWAVLDYLIGDLPDVDIPNVAASPTLALVVLADWIASSKRFISEQQKPLVSGTLDPASHFQRASELAIEHMNNAGLTAPSRRRRPSPADMLGAADVPKWTSLQASIEVGLRVSGPGIVVICAPTGEGKTEAALLAASSFAEAAGRNGLFFAMPTVATAEGLRDRIKDFIKRTSPDGADPRLRRVHSQAILYDDDPLIEPVSHDPAAVRAASRWMSGSRKSMLAPFGVGAVDQVLLGVLRGKHSPLRLFGAALGTLIVDEAHSLDPYMRKLLIRAVEWLAALGTPVVVMSATMPRKRISELVAAYQTGAGHETDGYGSNPSLDGYPMWSAWSANDGWSGSGPDVEPRRHWMLRFDTEDVPSETLAKRIAENAVAAAGEGKCVLVVRSTVRSAQDTYEEVRQLDSTLLPGDSVNILHSRMPHGVRRDRSERLMERLGPDMRNRPERMVLVATQVVEQSFDVDFDLLVTEPAPVSALLQRAGRVRRHRDDGQPVQVQVVWPITPGGRPHRGSLIYPKAELMAARACLINANKETTLTIRVPEDVPDLVTRADVESTESFEFSETEAEEAEESTLAMLIQTDADMSKAQTWAIPSPGADCDLSELTELSGIFDGDESATPGTRHRARSVLVLPVRKFGDSWELCDGTSIEQAPDRFPERGTIRAAFDAAIPVSYPSRSWTGELECLSGAWDRTPLARTLLLDASFTAPVITGGYCLGVNPETGLEIRRQT